MRKMLPIVFLAVFAVITAIPSFAAVVLEPCTYSVNFEDRLLGAWASYPLWQDTAYDPNFRINEIVPGDPNVSIEQKVTPYTYVDNYAGAQKLLDTYLLPGSTITLRYYLKSSLPFEYFKVRLAAGPDGKVDYTFPNPELNKWVWIEVTWDDIIRENPRLAAKDRIKVNALAVLAKLPKADPLMPFYLGLDDITIKGARTIAFQFLEPQVVKLPEWKPYIPKKYYMKGDTFTLRGNWPLDAGKVELTIVPYDDQGKKVLTADLKKDTAKKGDKRSGLWSFSQALSMPEGLYLCTLRALEPKTNNLLSETEFTIHIAPKNMPGKHPRLWFDSSKKEQLIAKLKTDRFKKVYDGLAGSAESYRKNLPVEKVVYDLDQYPDENWLPTWAESGAKIFTSGDAVNSNALAYALCGDKAAGEYTKNVLLKLAAFPTWNHPWQIKRGRFADHRSGAWSHRLALGYDLTYDLMTEEERATIRKAFTDYIVKDAFKSHVYDNNITCDTSNWIAMIAGGSLMMQAAMFGDGPDVASTEPYFTGTAMKLYDFLVKVNDPSGAWGEGYGYNNYSFDNLSRSLPSLENVFSIDFSKSSERCYLEYIWAGILKDKKQFYYGDSNGNLGPATNYAFLLAKTKDPLLGWYYNYFKEGENLMDALYETLDVPKKDPFSDNPVKLFRNVGTTVFKSGWEKDDFVFVMRTGAFYNHQHIDQGSFWLADRGSVFLEERHGSTYYDDPLYQPWYTQPVGHSTILIDGNHQSQRVGDPLVFADGFDDHARVTHFLDGEFASFSTGEIGDLYWGKVKSLERNMLYLKPRTVLMLDTVAPAEKNVDV
ncbi:MAG: heparinase II/III family protein, partial [Candidatus Latescibacterota bacterium]